LQSRGGPYILGTNNSSMSDAAISQQAIIVPGYTSVYVTGQLDSAALYVRLCEFTFRSMLKYLATRNRLEH